MTKRSHSPDYIPPSKVQRTLHDSSARPRSAVTFDTALYDELVLVVFSYLSFSDLCSIQLTSRNWARLSLDNQLWKALYLSEYGRTRLRGVRARKLEGTRNIKPLPERAAKAQDNVWDWKWMFKLGCNWRTGRCATEQIDVGDENETQIILAGNLAITAQTSLTLLSPVHGSHTMHTLSREDNAHITALALDQSLSSSHARHLRIASFLSTGEFSIFTIDHHTPSLSNRTLTYIPSSRNDRTTSIAQAVYHHPVILTLSTSFKLSIYDLSHESGAQHVQTLSSFSSYSPTSMVVSPISGTPDALKVVLVYTVPVYPTDWSVGVTELIISSATSGANVSSSRTIRAFDVPNGWIDDLKLKALRDQWGRRVARVADTNTDGKWVVLAPASPNPSTTQTAFSNPLQLYRLSLPSLSSSVGKLTFVRNLYGPETEVTRIWVADGRCVSLGADGSIWVWDLEERRPTPSLWVGGAQVCPPSEMGEATGSTVVFDESRIVSARNGVVEVRRFDV